MIACILCFGAIGLLCSARFNTTAVATVVAYLICLCWLGLAPLIGYLLELYQTAHNGAGDHATALLPVLSFGALLLLLLSLLPTAIIAGIYTLYSQRRLSRVGLEIIGGVSAIGAFYLLYQPDVLMDIKYCYFANPAIALYTVVTGGDSNSINLSFNMVSNTGQWLLGLSPDELITVAAAIGLLLLGGWLALMLAIKLLRVR